RVLRGRGRAHGAPPGLVGPAGAVQALPDRGGAGGHAAMSFTDMRQWIGRLEKAGALRRITAEVHRDRELGGIAGPVVRQQGPGATSTRSPGSSPAPRRRA